MIRGKSKSLINDNFDSCCSLNILYHFTYEGESDKKGKKVRGVKIQFHNKNINSFYDLYSKSKGLCGLYTQTYKQNKDTQKLHTICVSHIE